MRLYIIRHAQSVNNTKKDVHSFIPDPSLTPLGQEQARLLAQFMLTAMEKQIHYSGHHFITEEVSMPSFPITKLFCSASQRALETAYPLYETLGIVPEVWIDLHEIGGVSVQDATGAYVSYPGKTRQEIEEEFEGYILPDGLTERGWWHESPEIEEERRKIRAKRVVDQLMRYMGTDEQIAIITHGGFIRRLLWTLLGLAWDSPVRFIHYNTAITRIDYLSAQDVFVRYVSRIDHLPPPMISA